jgi:hypothetical protein
MKLTKFLCSRFGIFSLGAGIIPAFPRLLCSAGEHNDQPQDKKWNAGSRIAFQEEHQASCSCRVDYQLNHFVK